ncbi:MAG: hypothetical protein ACF8XB_01125 [Planctomycetota bacterium JB042]
MNLTHETRDEIAEKLRGPHYVARAVGHAQALASIAESDAKIAGREMTRAETELVELSAAIEMLDAEDRAARQPTPATADAAIA